MCEGVSELLGYKVGRCEWIIKNKDRRCEWIIEKEDVKECAHYKEIKCEEMTGL
jgi:hypothetical protein